MFCKNFQTFSTRNLAGQLHILQSLTNLVKNYFLTFSTEAQHPLRNAPCAAGEGAAGGIFFCRMSELSENTQLDISICLSKIIEKKYEKHLSFQFFY